nr:ABC transporter six-transmembrane domain-containing protein [Mannheimia varigena]
MENLLLLLYPLVGGLAVNAVMNHNVWLALLYAVMVFAIWSVGSARRAVDTRVFVRIYADLAVNAVLNKNAKAAPLLLRLTLLSHGNLSISLRDIYQC